MSEHIIRLHGVDLIVTGNRIKEPQTREHPGCDEFQIESIKVFNDVDITDLLEPYMQEIELKTIEEHDGNI